MTTLPYLFGTYGSGVPSGIGGSWTSVCWNAMIFLNITGKTQVASDAMFYFSLGSVIRLYTRGTLSLLGSLFMFSSSTRCIFQLRHLYAKS